MPSLESPRLGILSVPGLHSGIFLFVEKLNKYKGNKFQKSSADGNMSSPTPGRGAGSDRRRQPAELSVMKTGLGMPKSIN